MRAEKQLLTKEYLTRLNASPFFVVVNYQGLKVAPLTELRKRLKTINYNRGSLALKGYDNTISKKSALPHLLGEWHDLQVMCNHLNKGLNNMEINANEVIHLENLKTKISVQSELLFGQIREAIPSSEFFEPDHR